MIFKGKWLAPIAAALLLAACGEDTVKEKDASEPVEQQAGEEVASPYTVVDDRGMEVTFDAVPETIVSLQPSNTEILFSLGVGDKIVGATDYDLYPAEAQEIERVSDTTTLNAERIVELNPDVVVAYKIGEKAQIDQLEAAGLKVFVIQPATSFDDVYSDIASMLVGASSCEYNFPSNAFKWFTGKSPDSILGEKGLFSLLGSLYNQGANVILSQLSKKNSKDYSYIVLSGIGSIRNKIASWHCFPILDVNDANKNVKLLDKRKLNTRDFSYDKLCKNFKAIIGISW